MSQKENLIDIVVLLWQKRKTIIYSCIIAFIGTAIISLSISNYYKAETVFYAANPSLGNPSSLAKENKIVSHYGSNRDLDRLFTIAESSELFNALNQKYDLFEHYKINPTQHKAHSKLRLKFNKNYQLLKTKYDAFSLSFIDKNPKFSSDITNSARVFIDSIAQSVIKSSQFAQINTFEKNIDTQNKKLKTLLDSLTNAKGRYEIFNVSAQEEAMAELSATNSFKLQEYNSNVDFYTNNSQNRDSLRKYKRKLSTLKKINLSMDIKMNTFNKGANIVNSLTKEITGLTTQLNISNEKLKQLRATYSSPFKAIHLVEKAYEPDLKFGPKRSIYVVAATMFTFIFTIMVLVVLSSFNSVDWKGLLSDD